MTKKAQTDKLQQVVYDQMLETMAPFVKGWIETLGRAGAWRNKQVSPSTRVTSAKTGIELYQKLMVSGSTPAGEALLARLEALGNQPPPPDDDEPDDEYELDPDESDSPEGEPRS